MQKNNSGVNVKNNGHGHKKFIFDLDWQLSLSHKIHFKLLSVVVIGSIYKDDRFKSKKNH